MSNQTRRHQNHPRSTRNHRSYPQDLVTTNQAANCSLTICYSYLIAILSSFLVVVGLYLAITKFNARFLYISLTGLLIEATGACIYCLSNIRRSKLARHKHTNHFNLENANDQSQRPHTVTRMTHILSNNTFNQSAINNTTNAQDDEQRRPVIPEIQQNICELDQQISTTLELQEDGSPALEHINNEQHDIINDIPASVLSDQLPSTSVNPDITDSSINNDPEQVAISDPSKPKAEIDVQHVTIDVSQEHSTHDGSIPSASQLTDSTFDIRPIIQTTAHSSEVDLIEFRQPPISNGGLQVTDQTQDVAKRIIPSNSRTSNVRRTLVMGLGGEEEVIEIDEDNLDNMSILPPPYESISTTHNHQ